jgi:hypothetical protein
VQSLSVPDIQIITSAVLDIGTCGLLKNDSFCRESVAKVNRNSNQMLDVVTKKAMSQEFLGRVAQPRVARRPILSEQALRANKKVINGFPEVAYCAAWSMTIKRANYSLRSTSRN